jgi:diguanylate cyclase (GGDEF)-like protein/PAS domain S-box-containing protein
MLAVAALVTLLGYGLFAYWSMASQKERLIGLSGSLVQMLRPDLMQMTGGDDGADEQALKTRLSAFPAIESATLYSPQNEPLFHYSPQKHTPPPKFPAHKQTRLEGSRMHLYLPIDRDGSGSDTLYLQLQADSLSEILQRDLKVLVLIGLLTLMAAFLLAIRFESRFTAPILKLVAFLERMGRSGGALGERLHTKERNEFGVLYQEVNRMLDRMESSQEALRIAAVAFETPNGMVITDAHQRILQVNRAFSTITGYSSEEAVGHTPTLLQSGRHDGAFYREMWHSLQESGYWEGEIYNRQKNGEVYPERLTIQSVKDEHNQVAYYVGSFVDLTSLKQAEAQVHYLGLYDPLTGLANRRHLAQRLESARQSDEPHSALLCFDLDSHKLISDTFGHDKADELLIEVARRVRDAFGQNAFIARLGADELALVKHFEQTDQLVLQVEEVAKGLLEAVEKPYLLSDNFFAVKSRVGIALFPSPDIDAQTLIKQADLALSEARSDPDESIHFFDPQAEDAARHYVDTCSALQRALSEEEFCLYYQTQVDARGQVVGAEALIRWHHPQEGLLSPDRFIPVAERSHLIVPIGSWVIQKACEQLSLWAQNPTTADWTLSINISAQQFLQREFAQEIEAVIAHYGIRADRLKLELTESVLVDDLERAAEIMNTLRALGLELSLDDFGTGYASLSYLSRLPFSQIKIDRAFVTHLLAEKSDAAIVQSVLSLGQAFELTVVAEGVETQAQHDQLVQMGCGMFQGFYFSRPQPANELAA